MRPRHKVLVAHAEGEETVAEHLAGPLREAGYDVSHAGTVLIGDSIVEDASILLAAGAPVILCGTVRALGTGWAHRIVNAARGYRDVRVFPIQMEKEAYIQQLSLGDKVGFYWRDPKRTITDLVSSLNEHFPPDDKESASATKVQEQTSDCLREHIKFYDQTKWTGRAVPLDVTDSTGLRQRSDTAIRAWLSETISKVLIIGGDFGSGKTWLARRICRDLAADIITGESASPIPVFIPLSRLVCKTPSVFGDLLDAASPLPSNSLAVDWNSRPLLIVLDGLDELLISSGTTDAKQLLQRISFAVPRYARLLVTCRTQILERILDWIEPIFEGLRGSPEDRTGVAVDLALCRGASALKILKICDIQPEQADTYMVGSPAATLWQRVANQRSFREPATVPFTLFLLEEALPRLQSEKQALDLARLYEVAVTTWLYRDSKVASLDKKALWNRLEEIAEAVFTGLDTGDRRYDEVLVHCGILQRSTQITFRHFSILEYLVARTLDRQLAEYSASLLSRLNLIYMYNINRFLVSLLIRRGASKLSTHILPLKNLITRSGRVSGGGFLRFIRNTHWREREGYGMWTIKTARDGTAPFQGADTTLQTSLQLNSPLWSARPSLDDPESPVTGVSWYDAFQFCRWAGGRLPTAGELDSILIADSEAPYEWTSSWEDERASRITVVRTSGQSETRKHGVNPDLRSGLIGFRVVLP